MKMSKRFLAILLVLSLSLILQNGALADEVSPIQGENQEQEALESIAEDYISCKNGEFSEDISIEEICTNLAKTDPELVNAIYEHIESVATPIESALDYAPEKEPASSEPRRNGVYVRDGEGGYYIYDDFEDDFSVSEDTGLSSDFSSEDAEAMVPYSFSDYNAVTNPSSSRLTSTVCKIFMRKNSYWYYGTGFYVGKRVIATAAHCLYKSVWEGDFSAGWVNEGYVIQSYIPSQKDENTIKNRKYIDSGNIRVGASWIGNYRDDDDWGVVVTRESYAEMEGVYSYLPKKQIDANTYIGKSTTMYGYPALDKDNPQSMFYVKGKTTSKPSWADSTRVIYGTDTSGGDANGFHGMSGSPVVDDYGNVVAIFIGVSPAEYGPIRSKAVSLDKWLYKALKGYE